MRRGIAKLLHVCLALCVVLCTAEAFSGSFQKGNDQRQQEEQRKQQEAKQAEDAKNREEQKRQQEVKQADDRRQAEAKRAEESRLADVKRADDARQREEQKRQQEAKQAEDRRQADVKRADDARQREEQKRQQEAKQAEDRRQADVKRADETRQREEQKRQQETKQAEDRRQADVKRADETRQREEQKRQQAARQADERRQADSKRAEETRQGDDRKRKQDAKLAETGRDSEASDRSKAPIHREIKPEIIHAKSDDVRQPIQNKAEPTRTRSDHSPADTASILKRPNPAPDHSNTTTSPAVIQKEIVKHSGGPILPTNAENLAARPKAPHQKVPGFKDAPIMPVFGKGGGHHGTTPPIGALAGKVGRDRTSVVVPLIPTAFVPIEIVTPEPVETVVVVNPAYPTYAFEPEPSRPSSVESAPSTIYSPAPKRAKGHRTRPKGFERYIEGSASRYAAHEFSRTAPKPGFNWGGEPEDWLKNAAKAGWRVQTDIKSAVPGSLIVWSRGAYGHVAIVERVLKDALVISEMNIGERLNKRTGRTTGWGKITRAAMQFERLNRGVFRYEGVILPTRGTNQRRG